MGVRIVVPLKAVPDLVEEIEFTPDGTGIDREYLKFVLNEWDDQALEEALLVKEACGGEVVAVGLAEDPDIDQALFTALAKGADGAVKISGGAEDTHSRAALLAAYLEGQPADLIVTGVQAPDDLDGQLPPMLAARLGFPHASVAIAIEAAGGSVRVRQEFAGGRSQQLDVRLPAVVGVQASRQPPRYAPISRIRQVMQAGGLVEVAVSAASRQPALTVRRMYTPEQAGRAEMLAGGTDSVADQIIELLRSRGLVKG
jgi:electron transfer flavoprotein beta subunit